jgi:3-hydroxyacyl-CoA dehydrogenase
MDIHRVAVAGTGMMGPGMPFRFGGFETIIVNAPKNARKGGRGRSAKLLENGYPKNRPQGWERSVIDNLESGWSRLMDHFENLRIKQDTSRLDQAAPKRSFVPTPRVSALQMPKVKSPKGSHPHFWMPPCQFLVEVIAGRRTDLDIPGK